MRDEKIAKTPRFFRITASGKWFIFVTITLGIAAINTGNNLVYLCLAMNLSLMITSGILSDFATRKVYLQVFPGREIYAGKKGKIIAEIKNKKRVLPLFYLRIILESGEKPVEYVLPYLGPGRETAAVLEGSFSKRGVYTLRKVSVMTRFPFGFFEKYYHVKAHINVIVFPRPVSPTASEEAAIRFQNESDESKKVARTGHAGHSLKNIRKFLPNDPVKKVLWKKFMYTNKLYVKELEEEYENPVLIDVTPDEDEEAFERQVMRLAGKIVALRNGNKQFLMRMEDVTFSSSSYKEPYITALSLLSVVEKDGKGKDKLKTVLPLIRK